MDKRAKFSLKKSVLDVENVWSLWKQFGRVQNSFGPIEGHGNNIQKKITG